MARRKPDAAAATQTRLARALVRWYRANRRDLPWRVADGEAPDPYRIVVSEFMLQQTRVETVLRYYEPFLLRFPDTASLARARDAALRQAWQGMGYYRRATNLRAAAREVVARFDGQWPSDEGALRTLPGFGPYTAAAVAAIAFGRQAEAIDGNVLRVFSKWLGQTIGHRRQWSDAARQFYAAPARHARPAEVVQMWMELGATICRPRNPACGRCPLSFGCASAGRPFGPTGVVPRRVAPPESCIELLSLYREGKYLVLLRPAGLLGGQWGWPTISVAGHGDVDIEGWAKSEGGSATHLGEYRHVFSHRRWNVRAWKIDLPLSIPRFTFDVEHALWVMPLEIQDLAMPRAMTKANACIFSNGSGSTTVMTPRVMK